MKEQQRDPDARTGDRSVTARYSKAKAKDWTEPRRHGTKARGGKIERRYIDPQVFYRNPEEPTGPSK